MREDYTEANARYWLDRFIALHEKGTVTWNHFDDVHLARIGEHNTTKSPLEMRARRFGKTTYYKMREAVNPKWLSVIDKLCFHTIREIVLTNDQRKNDRPRRAEGNVGLATIFAAQMHVSEHAHKTAMQDLPGVYMTYRPSISSPGQLIVGCMRITLDNEELHVEEQTVYRASNSVDEMKQNFKGFAIYSQQYFLIQTYDNNSQFPRVNILRWPEIEPATGHVRELDGLYCGISQRPGRTIVASKILIRRAPGDGSSSAFEHAKNGVGYRHVNNSDSAKSIDKGLWDRVMDAGAKDGLFDF